MMKKQAIRGPLITSAVIFGILTVASFIFFISIFVWSDGIGTSLSRLFISGSRLPVTITVFGRSSDSAKSETISARIDFFTAQGDLAGTVERSWTGWELKIDCILIGAKNGWLVFPFLAYTDETKRGLGVDLFRYYNKNNFPVLYESSALRREERTALKRLFAIVRTEQWMPLVLGSLHHETVSVRSFEAGTQYSLFVTQEGTLVLQQN